MIAVLASRLDPEAASLVDAWSNQGAALLSAEDLCSPGWEFHVAEPARGTAVVNGQRIAVSDLRAVLTRRPAVIAEELTRIDPADRAYIAAETNAFLVAWLTALPCRVVNRPTPTSLCGPSWSAWYWRVAAARNEVDWVESDDATEPRDVVVCGSRCLFARTRREATFARRLAAEAGVELLGVRFRRTGVCSVSVLPALADEDIRGLLLRHLLRSQ